MYHLAKGLYLYATSKEEYSILLLGLDNAGKTTFLNQIKAEYLPSSQPPPLSASTTSPLSGLLSGDPNDNSGGDSDRSRSNGATSSGVRNPGDTVPTVGQNVSTIPLSDMYLRIWDIGGQHSLRRLWQSYYASCHAIVFIIDSTDLGDADMAGLAGLGPVAEAEPAPPRASTSSHPRGDGSTRAAAAAAAAAAATSEEEPLSPRTRRHKESTESANQAMHATENNNPNNPNNPSASNDDDDDDDDDKDAPSRGRLDECRLVLEDVLRHSDAEGVPLLVLANKQDREDCVEVLRIKEGLVRKVFEGPKGGGGVRDSRVLPVSALTGVGVREAVEWVCTRVKWNREGRPPVMR
ncbi:MAG: ADP-ribosylation factor protein 1 [Lichina confinis]|nr:MAG: ADP-ribosylation factor protein 1 [Lichina confinis]